jgi:hypothetical protein
MQSQSTRLILCVALAALVCPSFAADPDATVSQHDSLDWSYSGLNPAAAIKEFMVVRDATCEVDVYVLTSAICNAGDPILGCPNGCDKSERRFTVAEADASCSSCSSFPPSSAVAERYPLMTLVLLRHRAAIFSAVEQTQLEAYLSYNDKTLIGGLAVSETPLGVEWKDQSPFPLWAAAAVDPPAPPLYQNLVDADKTAVSLLHVLLY